MTVYLVGAGPGDPRLVTVRAAELLARAEVLLYDRLVSEELLGLAPQSALRIDVGKKPGESRPRRQAEINDLLVEHGSAGRLVVRLKGGDPFVFGRGGEEAEALLAAGIPFEVVPGVSAAFAVPAAAGVPVTHRGVSRSVTVVTGHVGDDAAAVASEREVDWEALARCGGTIVVMMGMRQRAEIARQLIEGGRSEKTPVLVVRNGTTESQQSVRCNLAELAAVELDAPAIIVVGEVAEFELKVPAAGALSGLSVVVTRPRPQSRALVSALEEQGARVVELPLISIAEPQDGGQALRRAVEHAGEGLYRWIVFTSANAVERFFDLVTDANELGGTAFAAVGAATAEALSEHDRTVSLVPERGGAEDLARAMGKAPASGDERDRSVLFPRAEQARDVLAPALRAAGWQVDEVVAYRNVAAGPEDGITPEAVRAASQADVVTFTSPSTVHHYLASAAGPSLSPIVACIGPTTALALAEAGIDADVVADDQSTAGLVRAIAKHVAQLRSSR